MSTLIRKHWPLFIAMGLYWAAVIVLVIISVNKNQGHLVYPLDDTYIHMAIAKNVVLHHIWGVTRYEFTSSTSSPLWTALLAVTYLIFGVNEVSPLVLTFVFGTLVILVSYLFLVKYIISRSVVFVILLFAVFAAPLPTLTVIGMEHVLHTFLSLCFVYFAIEVLSATSKPLQRYYLPLIVLSPLVTTVRYEGIFLVFVVCVLLLLQKRWLYAVILGTVALLPVIIYGIWSVANGWYFFPNSVLLKGTVPSFSYDGITKLLLSIPKALKTTMWHGLSFYLLITSSLLLLFLYRRQEKLYDEKKYANLIFIGCLLLHMQFVSGFLFYRYEAYLMFIGTIVVGISANELLLEKRAWKVNEGGLLYYAALILVVFIFITPFRIRAVASLTITPQATHNIYEQQYQMGLFLKRFYQGKTVAINDIGAVSYLADIRLFDLWGLGSMEPARLRLKKLYNTEQIYNLARQKGVTVAIAYDWWFDTKNIGGLPPQWIALGKWKIIKNVVAAGDTVILYAVDPSAADELIQNLRQFAEELPADVEKYANILNDTNNRPQLKGQVQPDSRFPETDKRGFE